MNKFEMKGRLIEGMKAINDSETANGKVTLILTNFEDQVSLALETLVELTPMRVKFSLDYNYQTRTYHNDAKAIEFFFEDYVNRNGWRRDYVPLGSWKKQELKDFNSRNN